MKWLSCFVLLCVLSVGVSGAESPVAFKAPRGISSETDIGRLQRWYFRRSSSNSYDTEPLKQHLRQRVVQDDIAKEAMELFIDCKYWHLVDYCEDSLPNMTPDNSQLFREVMVLLASRLRIGDYTSKVVSIIGDPLSITPDYFQNRGFVFDMFFYGAVENERRGYTWILTETCANVCTQLSILAKKFNWEEYERFHSTDVRYVAYGGALTEDRLSLNFTEVWPNFRKSLSV